MLPFSLFNYLFMKIKNTLKNQSNNVTFEEWYYAIWIDDDKRKIVYANEQAEDKIKNTLEWFVWVFNLTRYYSPVKWQKRYYMWVSMYPF